MNATSVALVAAQYVAGTLAVVPWRQWRPDPAGLAAAGLGLALLTWTLLHNRVGNWRILPEVKAEARLITDGPYRRVRHPMYLSVLILCAGLAACARDWPNLAGAVALIPILILKIRHEEASLRARFPAYEAYARSTSAFVPGIW